MKVLEILKDILHKQSRYKAVSCMKPYIKKTEEAIAELEAIECKKIINLCDGCKFEYWSYGKKFCQYDYECKRGCSMYADMYEERQ